VSESVTNHPSPSHRAEQSEQGIQRIDVEDVVVHFGATRALTRVSLTFDKATVTSLEGPNGAGKSTLLNVLATLVRPATGTVRFDQWQLPNDALFVRPHVGVVAHDTLAYPELTALETLALYARLYRMTDPAQAIARVVEQYALGAFASRPARTYSRGQLQRLSLARATLHDPSVLLFDEPTTGLDHASTERVITAIKDARARQSIVIVVTHDRTLAERTADRRVHLARGKIDRIDQASP
jgi:heme exporter protein A